MVKRFISFLLLSSLLCAPLVQAKTGSLWLKPWSFHPFFVVAAVNVACFSAYKDLYKKKDHELRLYSDEIQKGLESKTWLDIEPQARMKGFDQSITQIHNSNYPEEEIKALVLLLADLRNSIDSHYKSYLREPNKKHPSLRAIFDKLLEPHFRSINAQLILRGPMSVNRKQILNTRKDSFKKAQEWASTFDSYTKPRTSSNQLKKKIATKIQERDRLSIIPISLSGFVTMYYGLSYYFGSKK